MDSSNNTSSKVHAPTLAGNGWSGLEYAAVFLLLVSLKPMVVDAANDDHGQNAQNNWIDGCEEFYVMHASLLLLHFRYLAPSPAEYVFNIIINVRLMQKDAIRQNAAGSGFEPSGRNGLATGRGLLRVCRGVRLSLAVMVLAVRGGNVAFRSRQEATGPRRLHEKLPENAHPFREASFGKIACKSEN